MRRNIVIGFIVAFLVLGTAWLYLLYGDYPNFSSAKSINTLESYRAYVQRHQYGRHVREARDAIARLDEPNIWKDVVTKNNVTDYSNYLSSYPDGPHAPDAVNAISRLNLQEIDAISRLALQEIESKGLLHSFDKSVLEKHKSDFPKSLHNGLVDARIQELKQDHAWVLKHGTKDDILYCMPFNVGNPGVVKLLEQKLNKIRIEEEKIQIEKEIAEIAKGEHGELPPNTNGKGTGGAWSDVRFKNDTTYTLTLRLSGKTTTKLVIAPSASQVLHLLSGPYQVAASVDAARVSNYYGTDTYNGGDYEISYYIAQ